MHKYGKTKMGKNDEQRLRDFIRQANGLVWQAYLLMHEQGISNSIIIDSNKQAWKSKTKVSRRTYRIKKFAEELHNLNEKFCGEFRKEIYECACDNCLARLSPTSRSEFTPSHKRKSRCLGTLSDPKAQGRQAQRGKSQARDSV